MSDLDERYIRLRKVLLRQLPKDEKKREETPKGASSPK